MNWLKANLNYSQDEFELIRYGLSSITMEASKFLIMLVIFSIMGKTIEYVFGTFILLLLRINTGGLHFSTYIGCLIFSIIILYLGCVYLPNQFELPQNGMLILLLACIILNCLIGPVVSKKRPEPTPSQIEKSKIATVKVIFLYFIAVSFFSKHSFIKIGFWVIVLQTVQLAFAYFLRKEN